MIFGSKNKWFLFQWSPSRSLPWQIISIIPIVFYITLSMFNDPSTYWWFVFTCLWVLFIHGTLLTPPVESNYILIAITHRFPKRFNKNTMCAQHQMLFMFLIHHIEHLLYWYLVCIMYSFCIQHAYC